MKTPTPVPAKNVVDPTLVRMLSPHTKLNFCARVLENQLESNCQEWQGRVRLVV